MFCKDDAFITVEQKFNNFAKNVGLQEEDRRRGKDIRRFKEFEVIHIAVMVSTCPGYGLIAMWLIKLIVCFLLAEI